MDLKENNAIPTDESLLDLTPTPREHAAIEVLCRELDDLDSITVTLQSLDNMDLSQITTLFDGAAEEFPLVSHYTASDADIVAFPNFENAIVKVIRGLEDTLSIAERDAIEIFLLPVGEEALEAVAMPVAAKPLSFAERLIRAKQPPAVITSKYMNLCWISGTSKMVERLFSLAKQFQTYDRAPMTPEHLEMQLYLFINKEYWSKWTVNKVYQAEL